jgi:transcription termination/antitermination protein NusA
LVTDDQLSLAIGRRGQNVRLASRLVGWDIEIMTHDELAESLERAERWFRQLPHVGEEQIQVMIEEGFLSYNELTFIDAAELSEFTGLTPEQSEEVMTYAEDYADTMEASVEQERAEAEAAAKATTEEAQIPEEATEETTEEATENAETTNDTEPAQETVGAEV